MSDYLDKAIGCLIGGAMGDALGWPIEFENIDLIRRRHGKGGLSKYPVVPAQITDDTQMALYTAEGLMRMFIREHHLQKTPSYAVLLRSYHRWLSKQGYSVDRRSSGTEYRGLNQEQVKQVFSSGRLIHIDELNQNRSPGNTCTGALKRGKRFTFRKPHNSSLGCGGVMRAAPAGILYDNPVRCFLVGCNLAVLTHGNPIGYLSAGFLSSLVQYSLQHLSLREAIERSLEILNGSGDTAGLNENESKEYSMLTGNNTQRTANYINNAIELYESSKLPEPETIEHNLGSGWTGGEALSIAIYCSLVAEEDFERALCLAVNHSGDSDSTGAICGNILGAKFGEFELPDRFRNIELYDLIKEIACDIVDIRERPSLYAEKYPGW